MGEYLYVVHLDNLPLCYVRSREEAYRVVDEELTPEERERSDIEAIPLERVLQWSATALYVYETGGLEELVEYLNWDLHDSLIWEHRT